MDHWAYIYLAELHTAKLLPTLNYTNRPFTREQILHSLLELKLSELSPTHKNMAQMLLKTFKADTSTGLSTGTSQSLSTGTSQMHFGLLTEAGNQFQFFDTTYNNWFVRPGAVLETPYLSGTIRATGEQWYKNNPAYPWWKERAAAVRFSDNYIKTDFTHFTLSLGRCAYLWGPFEDYSLILSDNGYTFDHLFLQLRLSRFSLSQATTELEPMDGNHRFITMHRLDFNKSSSLKISAFESMLYQGANRNFDIRYITPFGLYFFEQLNNQSTYADGNSLIGCDFEFLWKYANFRAQFLIDDIQVDDEDSGDQEPPAVGGAAGVDVFYPSPLFTNSRYLTVEFRKITNRVYNVTNGAERYTYYGFGIGDTSNDFENLKVRYTFFPLPNLKSSVNYTLNRQGEGGINKSWGILQPGGNLGFRSEQSPTGIVYSTQQIFSENYYRPYYNVGIKFLLGYRWEQNIDNQEGKDKQGMIFGVNVDAAISKWWGFQSQ